MPQVVGMKQEIKDYLTQKGVPWEEVRALCCFRAHGARACFI
jgi:hypothetical protein